MDLSMLSGGVVEEASVTADSFVVDIEGFTHLTNARIFSNHSRKGSTRGVGDNKIHPNLAALEPSNKGSLHGGSCSIPEKPVVAAAHDVDKVGTPKIQHQITIKKGGLSTPPPPPESKRSGKRLGHRYSSVARFIHPRKILMFSATLSSMGTVMLIYFTLSIGNLNSDDNAAVLY